MSGHPSRCRFHRGDSTCDMGTLCPDCPDLPDAFGITLPGNPSDAARAAQSFDPDTGPAHRWTWTDALMIVPTALGLVVAALLIWSALR